MNCFAGYPRPVYGGYWAMLRFARDAKPAPILGEGGNPVIYPTEGEAWQAVTEHLLKYFNGNLRRDGDVLQCTRSAANMLFRLGKKPIPVESRR